jgi:dihydroorotase
MFDCLLTGGTVVNADGARLANIAITDGRIAAMLAPGDGGSALSTIDVTGTFLLPGLVDAHVHLREPGLTHKENFDTGTHAAALGGVTTLLDMPTDEPWTANAAQLAAKMALAEGRIHVDVGFQVVLGRELSGIEEMASLGPVSFELFTADVPEAFLFDTMDAVTETLHRVASLDNTVGISPGDQSILAGSARRNGAGDVAAFLASRPPLAEANGIARALLAAATTKARIHVRQVNSALGVETWRRLRDMADASVETTPQCLYFTSDDYETHGAALKGSPPMRDRADVDALRQAVASGLIDVMATDHAPHSPTEKAATYAAFADIPGGMPGVQTLLAAMLDLVARGKIGLTDLVRMCAYNPAVRFGLGARKGALAPGLDADILVLDPGQGSTISKGEQVSLAGYTPFDGLNIPFRLTQVFLRGREIVCDGVLAGRAQGQVVRR